jgi:hypothetical protein
VQLLARAANASLARAQLAEVLRSLGHNVRAQLQRKQKIKKLELHEAGFKDSRSGPLQLEEGSTQLTPAEGKTLASSPSSQCGQQGDHQWSCQRKRGDLQQQPWHCGQQQQASANEIGGQTDNSRRPFKTSNATRVQQPR